MTVGRDSRLDRYRLTYDSLPGGFLDFKIKIANPLC